MKFLSSDCTKTCFSCRRELNFEESEVAECSTESNEKSTKFRRKNYKDNYPKILNFRIVSAPKIDPKSHQNFYWESMNARWSQNAPKMPPRCSQDASQGDLVPKTYPKWSQDASKMLPRCSQDDPKASKMHPKLCQDGAKKAVLFA